MRSEIMTIYLRVDTNKENNVKQREMKPLKENQKALLYLCLEIYVSIIVIITTAIIVTKTYLNVALTDWPRSNGLALSSRKKNQSLSISSPMHMIIHFMKARHTSSSTLAVVFNWHTIKVRLLYNIQLLISLSICALIQGLKSLDKAMWYCKLV